MMRASAGGGIRMRASIRRDGVDPDARMPAAPVLPAGGVRSWRTASFVRISMTRRTLTGFLLFALAVTPLGAQPDHGKEELKLKLPKPMFIGTPTNLRSPNLEKVTGKPREPFFVPKGTVLL